MPPILVVIPTLGIRRDWFVASVRSILSQEGVDVRIRVVAPSKANLRSLCSALGVELIEYDRRGLSAAINRGWEGADDFEYVTWLGDDDLLSPGSLSATAAEMTHHPSASIVYGAVRYIDANGRTLWLQRPGRFAGWYLRYGKNLLPQQGSLLRRSAVRSVGGINESYKSAMDQDLFSRLIDSGGYRYVRYEVAAFRLHESNITVTKGDAGTDEGDEIRARHAGRFYELIRSCTQISDRVIYGLIRRWPYGPPPLGADGVPYTISRINDEELETWNG